MLARFNNTHRVELQWSSGIHLSIVVVPWIAFPSGDIDSLRFLCWITPTWLEFQKLVVDALNVDSVTNCYSRSWNTNIACFLLLRLPLPVSQHFLITYCHVDVESWLISVSSINVCWKHPTIDICWLGLTLPWDFVISKSGCCCERGVEAGTACESRRETKRMKTVAAHC